MSTRVRDARRETRDAKWPVVASIVAMLFGAQLFSAQAFAADLVDPTRPPAASRKSSSGPEVDASPRVSAIFQSGDRRVAVFHGQVVKPGDRVGDIFIESITAEGVRYRRNGRVEFARLPSQAAVVRKKIDSEETEP